MSGGHLNYIQYGVESGLRDWSKEPTVKRRFPKLATLFDELSLVLIGVLDDLDRDLSDDAYIKDDYKFEEDCINKIRELLEC